MLSSVSKYGGVSILDGQFHSSNSAMMAENQFIFKV